MNPSIIVYFLERFSAKWKAHPLASSSEQDEFIQNFNANCNKDFFVSFLSLDKQNKLVS